MDILNCPTSNACMSMEQIHNVHSRYTVCECVCVRLHKSRFQNIRSVSNRNDLFLCIFEFLFYIEDDVHRDRERDRESMCAFVFKLKLTFTFARHPQLQTFIQCC